MASGELKVFESYFLKPIPLVISAIIIYDLFTADWWWGGFITLALFYNGWRWSHSKQEEGIH